MLKNAPPLVLIGRKTVTTPEHLPENVFMYYSWPHRAVISAWNRCSIALAPSIWSEPFGIVVIEAMAAGKPVIASKIGGLKDIVEDGKTGYLVTPGDPVELSKAITRLLQDDALRAQLGEAGRHCVERFRARKVVPQIEEVYLELTGGKGAGDRETR
jgi:glycosyltransferase involved in cell wall biosynthesis